MIVFREFDPARDGYEAIVAIYNANWPDERQFTADLWRQEDDEWPEGSLQQRFIAELDGRIIGSASCFEKFWAHQPGTVHLEFDVDPACQDMIKNPDCAVLLLDHLVEHLRRRSPPTRIIATDTREDRPRRIALLQSRGFRAVRRSPRSSLDVTSFDLNAYDGLLERLAAKNVVINTLADLQKRDLLWKKKLHALRWAIVQDIPSVEPPTKPTMAEFETVILGDPSLDEAAWFIAVDESADEDLAPPRYIGMSNLWLNDPERKRLDTGLTGVLPAYRRWGIATALKLSTIEFARRQGALTIDTSNEERNPMFDLNLKLGFQPKAAWVSYRCELP